MATTKKKSSGASKTKSAAKPGKSSSKNAGKNKLGVKNSLVNNINAKKKKGKSKPKKKQPHMINLFMKGMLSG